MKTENTEVVETHAVSFKHSDVKDLLKQMEYLVAHPEIVGQYRNSASQFICNKYSWDDVVDQTIEVYQNINSKH